MGAAGIDGGHQRRWTGIDVTPVENDQIAARVVAVHCAMGLEGPSAGTDGTAVACERWQAGIEASPAASEDQDHLL